MTTKIKELEDSLIELRSKHRQLQTEFREYKSSEDERVQEAANQKAEKIEKKLKARLMVPVSEAVNDAHMPHMDKLLVLRHIREKMADISVL